MNLNATKSIEDARIVNGGVRIATELPRAQGLSIFATTIELPQLSFPAPKEPGSLLARLSSINSDWLPEESGLNE